MDWSLVLASQGIEATIDYAEDTSDWGLIVEEHEMDKALQSIQLYRLENRRWAWRHQVLSPGLLFDWASVLWVVLLCIFFWICQINLDIRDAGMMNAAKVGGGEWWRLFTAMWLHADVAHLAANATLGLVLLGLTMGRYGTGIGLLATYLAGVGGNLVVWFVAFQTPGRGSVASLGASGAVMGSLGLLAAQSFTWRPRTPQNVKLLITGVLGGLMLFVLFGLDPSTDVRAHLGGFLTGLLLGAVLSLLPPQHSRLNVAAGLVFLLLVLCPWWRALLHH
jgi:rhomboid protease GluP